jgi:glycogen operon protein
MGDDDWNDPENRVMGMLIHGDATDAVDERGHPIKGDTLLLLLNGSTRSRFFSMPSMNEPGAWRELAATTLRAPKKLKASGVQLVAQSLLLLRYELH